MSRHTPLVSVMMPCYNARPTLPMALASLLAQSYQNWECILVDDGSTDRPQELVEQAGDPRIRYSRTPRNLGLGAVRQMALDRGSGELMCGLDSDDWIFPGKIQRQVDAMAACPEAVVVGTGMSIVDAANEIAGVRDGGPETEGFGVYGPFLEIFPPFATAPCMVRMEVARTGRFDPAFRNTEDLDFFLQFMYGRRFGWLPDLSYVYTERQSATREKVFRSLRNTRVVLRRYGARYPVRSGVEIARTVLKEGVYRAAYALGVVDALIARRAAPPPPAAVEEFRVARAEVDRVRERVFGAD